MKRFLQVIIIIFFSLFQTSAAGYERIALLGDSMTWIGGDSCQNARGWSHYLKADSLARQIDVYARSGATWTNTTSTRIEPDAYSELLDDDNVIYNQAVRLIQNVSESSEAPDLVVLFAGANDAWFAKKRPGIYCQSVPTDIQAAPASVTSLVGSVSLVCSLIKASLPAAKLVVVTPIQMTKVDEETIHHVSDIIDNAARAEGCLVLRADKAVPISHADESMAFRFTTDGVHTNPEGARLIADFIISNLRQESLLNNP